MSEEDIIEEIKEWLNHETNFENLPEYDARNLYIKVKGLIDLYNKEKNQKILSDNIESFQKLFAEEISKIYISKDKIREILNEISDEYLEKAQKSYRECYTFPEYWAIKIIKEKLLKE